MIFRRRDKRRRFLQPNIDMQYKKWYNETSFI